MQAAGLGEPIAREELKRGDFVFWKGHVAIMEDEKTIVHANGHTMTTAAKISPPPWNASAGSTSSRRGYRRLRD